MVVHRVLLPGKGQRRLFFSPWEVIPNSLDSSSSFSSKMGVARFRIHMSFSSSETLTDGKWGRAVAVLSIGHSSFRVGV